MDDATIKSEYLSLVRWASHAGSQGEKFVVTNETSSRSHFRKIITGVLFSRRFILTYQLVLLSAISFLALIHCSYKTRSWRTRYWKQNGTEEDGLSTGRSSSSSTLIDIDTASPKFTVKPGEHTSLLQRPENHITLWSRIANHTRAGLVYQPSPIPILNKTLPSNGCSLLVFGFMALQVFYTFYNVPLSTSMLFIFADRTSLVFVANLPLLYLFAAKNQPIKMLTGSSYETLNIFHRRLGECMCLLAFLHSIGMLGVWYTLLQPTGLSLAKFVLEKIILLGLGALSAYGALYMTSLGSFRQRWYELFLALHVVLQVMALILLYFHHHGSRPYVAVALIIFLTDRLVFRMFLKSRTTKAFLEVMEDRKTVSVYAKIPVQSINDPMSWSRRPGLVSGWKATDHVFLSIPSLGWKHRLQSHPFTIKSRAPRGPDIDSSLDLIIRAQDGFSGDLVEYAKAHPSTTVRLDGPYGSQSAVRLLQESDLGVIIAGGSGIAVAWPLVWSVLDSQKPQDEELSTKPVFTKKVLFVWIVRQQSHLSWISREDLDSLKDAGADVVIPPATETHGHPDIRRCLTDWIMAHGAVSSHLPNHVGIVCSGPDGMNRTVRNSASALISKGHPISVEIEKFGW